MKKDKEWVSFSETDSKGVFREAYGYFEKRTTGFRIEEYPNDAWKRLCKSEIPGNVCTTSEHDFVRFDEITGGKIYKCKKCGLEAVDPVLSGEFDKAFLGSFVDGCSFVWQHDCMDTSKIVKFSLSFGDYPIRNVLYERNKITYKNSINGSRDGWMTHPRGFFNRHSIRLIKDQREALQRTLSAAHIDSWKTDPHIFNNIGACGFCLSTTFECVFENGRSFICYSPYRFDGFNMLTSLLSEICGFSSIADNGKKQSDSIATAPKRMKALMARCCYVAIPEDHLYCPKCGKKIEDKESAPHWDVDYDPDQTSWLCECLNSNALEYQYCSKCGKRRPF